MSFSPEDYEMHAAQMAELDEAMAFYNDVIAVNRKRRERVMQWREFEPEATRAYIEAGELFVVRPMQASHGSKAIVAAVILDYNHEAWSDIGTPENTLHLAKFAVKPGQKYKGFGKDILWPQVRQHAQEEGCTGICCEAFNDPPGLPTFYLGLGFEARGEIEYESGYYDTQIAAERFYYDLRQ